MSSSLCFICLSYTSSKSFALNRIKLEFLSGSQENHSTNDPEIQTSSSPEICENCNISMESLIRFHERVMEMQKLYSKASHLIKTGSAQILEGSSEFKWGKLLVALLDQIAETFERNKQTVLTALRRRDDEALETPHAPPAPPPEKKERKKRRKRNFKRENLDPEKADKPPERKKNLYVCEHCGRQFNRNRLKYHMNTHFNIFPYACDAQDCSRAFKNPGNLRVHKQIHHLKLIRIHCGTCNKGFKTKADHDLHVTYHGAPQLPCSVCSKLLANRKTLRMHMFTHSGIRSHKCTFEGCKKAFTNSTGLSVHMRSHTKAKPYECTFKGCGERFTYKIGLRKHWKRMNHRTE